MKTDKRMFKLVIDKVNWIIKIVYDTPNDNYQMELRRPYTRQLRDTANVISIPQELYGESVKPESVRIVDDSTDVTIRLQDDGRGNLYDIAHLF